MVILPRNSAPDILERRLHGLAPGGIPTAEDIINAVGTAGTSRVAARLQNWAVGALRRVGANEQAGLMQRRAEQTSRGQGGTVTADTREPTPEELEAAGL